VKAFLKSGILTEGGQIIGAKTGTPQGGILSPLLANIALSILDEHFAEAWESWGNGVSRHYRRSKGLPTYRLARYADDFVVMVAGTKEHAEALRDDVAAVLLPMGLRLSEEKTTIVHIDEGFDFLGFRIQRQVKRGSSKRFVYTWPAKKALASITAKVKMITRMGTHHPLTTLLRRLNLALAGWTNYFKHGVSKATFGYLGHYTWFRVLKWLRRKHRRAKYKAIWRRYLRERWWPAEEGVVLFNPDAVPVTRYRYRGVNIASPWDERIKAMASVA